MRRPEWMTVIYVSGLTRCFADPARNQLSSTYKRMLGDAEEEHTALRNGWLPRAAQVGCEAVTYPTHT